MGIMQSLRKKDRRDAEIAPAALGQADAPGLVMLLPDAAGIATYHLQRFQTARAAELFIDSTLRGPVSEGTVLFWALTWQPASDAEPVVLVRDDARQLVYLFSFIDLAGAYEFVRHELLRGLGLGQVMVYWAVPADAGSDAWGAAVITPMAAPEHMGGSQSADAPGTILPFAARAEEAAPAADPRYLTEADIAETIREMDEFVQRPPAREVLESAAVIDFPAALEQLDRTRRKRIAAVAWANFGQALDEALDVHVSVLVSNRLAWKRIVRALGEAARAQQEMNPEADAEPSNPQTPGAAVASGGDGTMRRAWHAAATALAQAAQLALAGNVYVRAWRNAGWGIEEAVYAYRLETRARVARGWRFASLACGEAAAARISSERAVHGAWEAAGAALGKAADVSQRRTRAMAAWARITVAINGALEAKTRRDAAIAAWAAIGQATNAAAVSLEQRDLHDRIITGWTNATTALMEAIVAEAKLRILQAGLDKKLVAAVDRKVKGQAGTSSARPAGTSGTVVTRWDSRDEPFQGFHSPPGRF